MEEFKNQLSIFVPLTANLLIKLERNLKSIEYKIRICKEQIKNKQILLKCKNVKEFISENINQYKACSNVLSSMICAFSKLNFEFIRFETEMLNYKRSKLNSINQMIEDRMQMNDWSIVQISNVLENVQESFKVFCELNEKNLTKRNQIDQNIPLIVDQLNELKQCTKDLNMNYLDLNELADKQQKSKTVAKYQLRNKQQIYEEYRQQNQSSKLKLNNENNKLIELKCRIRKSIFEYLNKVKRLNQLTDEKNLKIVNFKNQFNKYNQKAISELNEKRLGLKLKIDNFDKLCSDLEISNEPNDEMNDENKNTNMINKDQQENTKESKDKKNKIRKQKKNVTKDNQQVDQAINITQSDQSVNFTEQLEIDDSEMKVKLIDKLNCLNETYDRLITTYECEIQNKLKTLTNNHLKFDEKDDQIYNSLKSKSKSYERK